MNRELNDACLTLLLERGVLAAAFARGTAITSTSPKLDELFGFARARASGMPIAALAAEGDRDRVTRAVAAAVAHADEPRGPGAPGYVTLVFDALRADGSVFEAEMTLTSGEVAGARGVLVLVTDLAERRRAAGALSYRAYLDPVTGLANGALFRERARETATAARADGRPFALMMGAIIGLEQVRPGSDAADALLQAAARRAEAAVRAGDTVAHAGEHVLGVLLPHVARRRDAAIVAERLVRAFDAPFAAGEVPVRLGIRLGIATFPADGDGADALVRRAEAAWAESGRQENAGHAFAAHAVPPAPPSPHADFGWSEGRHVGVPLIDAQHRRLVGLMSRLAGDLVLGRARDATLRSLAEVVAFTRSHFATEERLMAQHHGWALEEAHREEHRRLLDDLVNLSIGEDAQSIGITIQFLHRWLMSHIDGMDRELGRWLGDPARSPAATA